MAEEDIAAAADRILAGLDFARAASAAEAARRQELERLLGGFLEVVDSLEALEHWSAGAGDDLRWTLSGTIQRIRRQALEVLEQAGVEPLDCAGKPLDLSHSEVVEVRIGTGAAEDTVVEEVLRGYTWRGRLLRRPRVVIAREDGAPGAAGEADRGTKGA
jgi:molecular chaperone GrpE